MPRTRGTLVLSGLLATLACGKSGDAEPAARIAVPDATLVATITTDRPAYSPGEPVTLTLTLRNTTTAPATLEFASAQRYDCTIEDAGAQEVWRWSAGQMFAQMLGEETLGAGDSVVYRERFAGTLSTGSYRVRGTVMRIEDPITASAEFQVR